MKCLFSAILSLSLYLVAPFLSSAQTSQVEKTVFERISRLERICGQWTGSAGETALVMSFEMDESSSAIGELQKQDMVYFLHCFTDDMNKLDAYKVGKDGYDFCVLEQNGGENVGIYYLSFSNAGLYGVYLADYVSVPVSLSRVGGTDGQEASVVDLAKADEDKWENARYLDTRESYESYLSEFPSGKYAGEARELLAGLADRHAWEAAADENTMSSYRKYLESSVEPKAYASQATGRIALMEAEAADAAGNYNAVLDALAIVEATIGLDPEAVALKDKNAEIKAYKKYVDSYDDKEAIANGIEYVNTFLRGEKRAEVSDRVAYLMASTPEYLAGTSCEVMLTYAVTDETREYVIKQTKKAAKQRSKRSSKSSGLGFNGGIGASVETPMVGFTPTYGGHFLFSIGDNRNFFNFEFGLRYRYLQFDELTPELGDVDFHHIRLVAAPKFNIVRQKKSAFYMYIAPELGYGYPIDMHATKLYNPNSLSLGGRVGVGVGRFELSAMFTQEYIPIVNEKFPEGRYSNQLAGLALSFYFSGSGRK